MLIYFCTQEIQYFELDAMRIYKLTNPQKILGTAALAVAAGVSFLISFHSSDVGVPAAVTEKTIVTREVELQVVGDSLPALAQQASPAPVAETPKPEVAVAAVPVVSSWKMGDVKSATPKIILNEKISAYAIVELEQHPASYPAVGEQIELPMLNGQKVVANIESVTKFPNGDYSWSGHLVGHGTDFPIVMTYGEHSIFATITTPEGSYSMESLDGLGWLYKNPAEVELSNPGYKDFLEVNAIQ